MTVNLETLREYVHDLYGELDSYDEENQQLCFRLYPTEMQLICFIDILSEGNLFILSVYPSSMSEVKISSEQADAVMASINLFNTRSSVGRWALLENGVIRWNFTWMLEDSPITRRQMASVFQRLMSHVTHEANVLQIRRKTGLNIPLVSRGISCTVVDAVLFNPSAVKEICEATAQPATCTESLFYMVGEKYAAEEDASGANIVQTTPALLN